MTVAYVLNSNDFNPDHGTAFNFTQSTPPSVGEIVWLCLNSATGEFKKYTVVAVARELKIQGFYQGEIARVLIQPA